MCADEVGVEAIVGDKALVNELDDLLEVAKVVANIPLDSVVDRKIL